MASPREGARSSCSPTRRRRWRWQLVPDAPPPERLEAALRGREAAARLLWNPHVAYRKLTSRLGRIKAPTLVVWGAQDRLLPLALGEAYQRGIPGATLDHADGCGHLPPFEQPERFARRRARLPCGAEAPRRAPCNSSAST